MLMPYLCLCTSCPIRSFSYIVYQLTVFTPMSIKTQTLSIHLLNIKRPLQSSVHQVDHIFVAGLKCECSGEPGLVATWVHYTVTERGLSVAHNHIMSQQVRCGSQSSDRELTSTTKEIGGREIRTSFFEVADA